MQESLPSGTPAVVSNVSELATRRHDAFASRKEALRGVDLSASPGFLRKLHSETAQVTFVPETSHYTESMSNAVHPNYFLPGM